MIRIKLEHFTINRVSDSSGIYQGINVQSGGHSSVAESQGFGTVSGSCNLIYGGVQQTAKQAADEAQDHGGQS